MHGQQTTRQEVETHNRETQERSSALALHNSGVYWLSKLYDVILS